MPGPIFSVSGHAEGGVVSSASCSIVCHSSSATSRASIWWRCRRAADRACWTSPESEASRSLSSTSGLVSSRVSKSIVMTDLVGSCSDSFLARSSERTKAERASSSNGSTAGSDVVMRPIATIPLPIPLGPTRHRTTASPTPAARGAMKDLLSLHVVAGKDVSGDRARLSAIMSHRLVIAHTRFGSQV